MMMSSGSDLLSARASVIWIAALCAVLVFHCSHLFHMGGERRWYHSAHVVMLLGMLYMYAAVAFGVDWLPTSVWMIIYVATSAAIIGWMLVRYMRRHSFGYLVDPGIGSARSNDLHVDADEILGAPAFLRPCRILRAGNDCVADEGIYQAKSWKRSCGGRRVSDYSVGAQIGLWRCLHDHHGCVHGIYVRRDAADDVHAASIPAVGATAAASTIARRERFRPFRFGGGITGKGAESRYQQTGKATSRDFALHARIPCARRALHHSRWRLLAWHRRPALWRRAAVAQHHEGESWPPSPPTAHRSGHQIANGSLSPVGGHDLARNNACLEIAKYRLSMTQAPRSGCIELSIRFSSMAVRGCP